MKPDSHNREEAHSPLGASSATRWMNCPGSVRLSDGAECNSMDAARIGSVAHYVAEQDLLTILGKGAPLESFKGHPMEVEMFTGSVCPRGTGPDDGVATEQVQVGKHMIAAISLYTGYVRGILSRYKSDETTLHVELRVRAPKAHTAMYGTVDALIECPDALHVIDYKNGKTPVDEGGPQMKYYACCWLAMQHEAGVTYSGDMPVHCTIVQPNDNRKTRRLIRTVTYSIAELRTWMQEELLPAMCATEAPDAKLCKGKWCFFCPAKSADKCPKHQTRESKAAAKLLRRKKPEQAGKHRERMRGGIFMGIRYPE